jgi:GT2 family glycosyltransferase
MSRKRVRRKPKKKKEQTLVDICIPVHGRFDLLERCLLSIPDAIGNISRQIIIFDNNSNKEEADEFYSHLDKSIRVTRSKENLGFPKACNRMVSSGRSPLIFLLNSDVILDKDSIDLLVRTMDDPKIGVAGMKLIFPDDVMDLTQNPHIRPAGKIQHIGLTTNIRAEVIHAFMAWSPDHPRVNAQREVFAVTGAALMTRRDIWRKVRGFREEYGLGTYEECDYQMSVREMGYNIVVVPEASGVHYTGATSEHYGIGYNLMGNQMTFMQRWNEKIDWWQWRQI